MVLKCVACLTAVHCKWESFGASISGHVHVLGPVLLQGILKFEVIGVARTFVYSDVQLYADEGGVVTIHVSSFLFLYDR